MGIFSRKEDNTTSDTVDTYDLHADMREIEEAQWALVKEYFPFMDRRVLNYINMSEILQIIMIVELKKINNSLNRPL